MHDMTTTRRVYAPIQDVAHKQWIKVVKVLYDIGSILGQDFGAL
jgi:hypothetical protein